MDTVTTAIFNFLSLGPDTWVVAVVVPTDTCGFRNSHKHSVPVLTMRILYDVAFVLARHYIYVDHYEA
jgi:hypothetical protein